MTTLLTGGASNSRCCPTEVLVPILEFVVMKKGFVESLICTEGESSKPCAYYIGQVRSLYDRSYIQIISTDLRHLHVGTRVLIPECIVVKKGFLEFLNCAAQAS